ncbi:single-stranded DNA-binding protein [Gulosibacter chungangensis]|uniref:Single-stranded DNA-binding protein n=1 Tax=Gulosibacter chungangensis TaxID=979746 RepID=A0A7J5BB82_9MICO|nr:single-stranded DNA-binding protein [Gulosibacter chungangensis]KAB1642724.1 single-stranded DNA-binding protein [Gulosibacter chungangensis]
MTDFITVTGTIGTDPDHKVVGDQLSRTTFRLACSERRRTADGQGWEDSHTNWYSVTSFGRLAANAIASVAKGQRVIVSGKLRIRTYAREDGSQGTQVEIIANTIGHDLAFQISTAAKFGSGDRSNGGANGTAEDPTPSNDSLASAMGAPSSTSDAPYPGEQETRSYLPEDVEVDGVSVDEETGEVFAATH